MLGALCFPGGGRGTADGPGESPYLQDACPQDRLKRKMQVGGRHVRSARRAPCPAPKPLLLSVVIGRRPQKLGAQGTLGGPTETCRLAAAKCQGPSADLAGSWEDSVRSWYDKETIQSCNVSPSPVSSFLLGKGRADH